MFLPTEMPHCADAVIDVMVTLLLPRFCVSEIFCDFGENFTVFDPNGEQPLQYLVERITQVSYVFAHLILGETLKAYRLLLRKTLRLSEEPSFYSVSFPCFIVHQQKRSPSEIVQVRQY